MACGRVRNGNFVSLFSCADFGHNFEAVDVSNTIWETWEKMPNTVFHCDILIISDIYVSCHMHDFWENDYGLIN